MLNRYAYCRNNPIIYTDPTGHFLGVIGPALGEIGTSLLSSSIAIPGWGWAIGVATIVGSYLVNNTGIINDLSSVFGLNNNDKGNSGGNRGNNNQGSQQNLNTSQSNRSTSNLHNFVDNVSAKIMSAYESLAMDMKPNTDQFIREEEEGQLIVNDAKTWEGTPYEKGGERKGLNGGTDCSHSTYMIYKEAGFNYNYSSSKDFPNNPNFGKSPGNIPQQGDVGWSKGHMLIFDRYAGAGMNSWTARRSGFSYGPNNTKYFGGNTTIWYRYIKK